MKIEYENLMYKVKRKHSFKYRPSYSESFKTNIKENQIIPLIIHVIETLEWLPVYHDKNIVEAKCVGEFNKRVAKFKVVKKSGGRIEVSSTSIDGHLWDIGKNSKRTGVFIALFNQIIATNRETNKLQELEEDFIKRNEWTDYVVPNKLTPPTPIKSSTLLKPLLVGLLLAIIAATLIAIANQTFGNLIFFYELIAGLILGYLYGKVLVRFRFTNYDKMKMILILMTITVFSFGQYLQYHLIFLEEESTRISFWKFKEMQLQHGLRLDSLNTGWVGFVISWGIQLYFLYIFTLVRCSTIVIKYIIERIPEDVVEFTIYLFRKDYSESSVRTELAVKGWKRKEHQDEVMEAIGAIQGYHESRRE